MKGVNYMAVSFEELTKELKSKNIRLSHQRLKILEFIYNNKIHPTVDEIYKEIQKEIPTLSRPLSIIHLTP